MNHYTYLITYTDGRKYIGVRSCKCAPEDDTAYVGSSRHTPNRLFQSKQVLQTFPTREAAVVHEVALHEQYQVTTSPEFYNRSRQTSTKFDTSGVRFDRSIEHNEKIRQALTGRKRSPEECARISAGKRGVPRSVPHSAETRKKIGQAHLGKTSPMKGKQHSLDSHLKAYASRTQYSDVYTWIHEDGSCEQATCIEMGSKYGIGVKPTGRFRNLVKGIAKSYRGWRLETGSA